MTTASVPVRAGASPLATLKDLVLLAKPRLSGLVVLTSAGGLALAPGRIGAARAVLTVLGTAAVVGAANALNNYLERDVERACGAPGIARCPRAASSPSWRSRSA